MTSKEEHYERALIALGKITYELAMRHDPVISVSISAVKGMGYSKLMIHMKLLLDYARKMKPKEEPE